MFSEQTSWGHGELSLRKRKQQSKQPEKNKIEQSGFFAVFRIRISFHADPDPGSQKCPYGSGSKEVNTKEE